MAYNTTKVAGNKVLSNDWNSLIDAVWLPVQENKRGSDCSGSDGAVNRILTLANTTLTDTARIQVWKNGLLLHDGQYTVTHAASASTVQFTDAVFNTDYIKVVYSTGRTS